MKKIVSFLLFSFHTFLSYSQYVPNTEDSLRGILSEKRNCFDVFYYKLSLRVEIDKKYISGTNQIYFEVKKNFSELQLDLAKELSITKITSINDRPLTFRRESNTVFVLFDEIQKKDSLSFITVFYEGAPAVALDPPWNGGFVWTTDSLGNPWVAVACEGIGASKWWPCKDHPSDEPDSVSINIEVPQNLFCASNGTLLKTTTTSRETKLYEWFVHYPINTYNVTLNIGNYAHLSDTLYRKDRSSLALDYYVLSYNLERARAHFKQVKLILETYETLFGNYPFQKDGYALIEAPYWGMEHQSAIAYGNHYKNNLLGLDYILVHESGHEWWGNNVSCADHSDLWIHEAFTTYGETLLIESIYTKKIAHNYIAKQKPLIKNKEPIIGPYAVNYHYWNDADMYYKGAWMLHSLRHSIDNDSLWFSLLLIIQEKYAGKQLSSAELIQYINTTVKFDYTAFFKQYLTATDIPVFEYHLSKKSRKQFQLHYRWAASEQDFAMPCAIILKDNTKIRIEPSKNYKTLTLDGKNKTINMERLKNDFYIEVKKQPRLAK